MLLSHSLAVATSGARLSQVDANTQFSEQGVDAPIDTVMDQALLDRRAGPVSRLP